MTATAPMSDKVSAKLTVFNFVLTFFVVFSHWTNFFLLTLFGESSLLADTLTEIFSVLGIISIASFFMLSGYLFYRNTESLEDLQGKVLRRLVTLGIPFLFWNVVYLIYNIAYGLYKGNLDMGPMDVILGFTLNPFDSPMWYLLALLVLMCLSPLVMMLKKHPHTSLCAVGLIFIGACLVSLLTSGGSMAWNWIRRLISYCPLYFFGAFLGMHYEHVVSEETFYNKNYSLLAGVLSVLIIATIVIFDIDVAFRWIFYQLLPILLWIAVPANLFKSAKIPFALTVSPFVYAMHSVLILILNSVWTQKLFGSVDFPLALDIIFWLLLCGVLYGVCLGVAFLAKKILPEKIYRIFAGGSAGRKMF